MALTQKFLVGEAPGKYRTLSHPAQKIHSSWVPTGEDTCGKHPMIRIGSQAQLAHRRFHQILNGSVKKFQKSSCIISAIIWSKKPLITLIMMVWYAFTVQAEPYKISTDWDFFPVLFFKRRSSSLNGVTAMAGDGADTDVKPHPSTSSHPLRKILWISILFHSTRRSTPEYPGLDMIPQPKSNPGLFRQF